jgi:hypothetical protein
VFVACVPGCGVVCGAIAQAVSRRWPGFAPRSVHVRLVVDKAALGQVSLRVLLFSPVSIIPPLLHIHVSSGGWTMGPLAAAVPQRHSLTPSQQ